MNERSKTRNIFLNQAGWGNADIVPLAQDASFRRYFRLHFSDSLDTNHTVILMDAPPDKEPILPFVNIANHLSKIDIQTPEILVMDTENGYILLEDMGDDTFTKLLNNDNDPLYLYDKAIEVLIKIHCNNQAPNLPVDEYHFGHIENEILLFTQWYFAAAKQQQINVNTEKEYIEIWKNIFKQLPPLTNTLVLRDYHVDNLMMKAGDCAVLDFQDALIGSPAYDVVSLLEDARRDIDPPLIAQIYQKYINSFPDLDKKDFADHYIIWGVQRHCKVLGIFTRLWIRDNKPQYLIHLPRVLRLLFQGLQHPLLSPLKSWFDNQNINQTPPDF